MMPPPTALRSARLYACALALALALTSALTLALNDSPRSLERLALPRQLSPDSASHAYPLNLTLR